MISMMARVLFVLTSHAQKGETGDSTGFYLSEVTHPYDILSKNNIVIDFVSPQGGEPPIDGLDLKDQINAKYMRELPFLNSIQNTMKPEDVDASRYDAVFYAGGHGTMWDFPNHPTLPRIAERIYQAGGIISGVCHGPAGILDIKNPDGSYVFDGKEITCFSNKEEVKVGMEGVVPFMLETKIRLRGGIYSCAPLFQKHVIVDGRLITGQNPASAAAVGEELVRLLKR